MKGGSPKNRLTSPPQGARATSPDMRVACQGRPPADTASPTSPAERVQSASASGLGSLSPPQGGPWPSLSQCPALLQASHTSPNLSSGQSSPPSKAPLARKKRPTSAGAIRPSSGGGGGQWHHAAGQSLLAATQAKVKSPSSPF